MWLIEQLKYIFWVFTSFEIFFLIMITHITAKHKMIALSKHPVSLACWEILPVLLNIASFKIVYFILSFIYCWILISTGVGCSCVSWANYLTFVIDVYLFNLIPQFSRSLPCFGIVISRWIGIVLFTFNYSHTLLIQVKS